jgi:serine/threonine protein kinase
VEPLKPNDPSQLGDWSITGRLGEGEDSVIYLGVRGVAGSEQAAIKLIEDDSFEFESALGKIKNEVEALRQLNNESIVKFLEANYEQGNLWIATEYIHGVTLDTKLKQTKEPLEELYWFRIAENIFYALEAAHAKGIIHKDIKPSNIILGASGAKLIDFGISHVPERTRSAKPGDFEGSRLFSAPENYNRRNIEEMDVFSAGVTLAYAAKLKSVWAGDNQDAITESIKNDEPDLSGLTPLQEEFIRPLLEKLPIDRPNSAAVHRKALEYVEYLVDKERKSKPAALRVKKSLSRRIASPWMKWGVPVGIVSAIALVATTPWNGLQNIPSESRLDRTINLPGVKTSSSSNSLARITPYTAPAKNSVTQINIEKAEKEFYAGDYGSSLKFSLVAAKEGNARAANLVGLNYEELKKTNLAIEWYRKSVSSGYGNAFVNLGSLLIDLKRFDEGIAVLESGAAQKHPASINELALYYSKIGNIEKSKQLYLQASELGHAMSMYNYGTLLQNEGKNGEAKKWYLKSVDAGYTYSLNALGYLYEQEADWTNARKYYEKSAEAGDPFGMYNLAIVLGNYFSDQSSRPCDLLNQALGTKNLDPELLPQIRSAISKGCSTKASVSLQAEDKAKSSPSPSPTGKISDGDLMPLLSYGTSQYSEKVSSDVKTSGIFGRAFLKNDLEWVIPLTNSKNESVPPINRVQFRDASLPYGSWWNLPYELKDGGNVGWHAVVSNLGIQLLHSSGKKVCPEFRFALVQNNLVTYIWTKSVEPCTVP